MCGKNGKCINLFQDFKCDCYPFFEGKFCEKFDTKAIQILIGSIIVLFLATSLIAFKIMHFVKEKRKRSTQSKIVVKDGKSDAKTVKDDPKTISRNMEGISRSISKVMRRSFSNIMQKYFQKEKKSRVMAIVTNLITILPIICLTCFQIICIHSNLLNSFDRRFSSIEKIDSIVKGSCDFLDKYLFEELIYLIFVCIICIVIIAVKKNRRYSEVITKKHHAIIAENAYKENNLAIEFKKEKSETKFSLLKVFKIFKSKTSIIAEKLTITPSIPFSLKGRANTAAVYVLYTYDVLNILMSVYAENISASFFSGALNVSKFSGVLVDLLFQFCQVFLIGFKFYPILAAADGDSNPIVYFFTFVYLLFMFTIRLTNKAFCSQKKDFARRTLTKLSKEFTSKLKNGLELRYNISNNILSVFSDDPNPNEKYIEALKGSIPLFFRDAFEKMIPEFNASGASEREIMNYFPMPSSYYENSSNQSSEIFDKVSLKNTTRRVFLSNKTEETISKLTDKISFQLGFIWNDYLSILENLPLYFALAFLIMKFIYKFFQCFNEEDWLLEKNTNNEVEQIEGDKILLKNVLFSQDSETVKKKGKERKKRTNSNVEYIKQIVKVECLLGESLVPIPQKKIDMQKDLNLPEKHKEVPKRSNSIKASTSFMLNLFETYIYKPIPNLKYSKQFINTYTVAFMILYLFTIYGWKVSNVFSQMIIKLFYLMFKFILSEYRPFFKIENLEFRYEFRIACVCTSSIAIIQLLLSIRTFRRNLVALNKGEKFFSSLLIKNQRRRYVETLKKTRESMSDITGEALHFPGYFFQFFYLKRI
jgi:hypothetical protein